MRIIVYTFLMIVFPLIGREAESFPGSTRFNLSGGAPGFSLFMRCPGSPGRELSLQSNSKTIEGVMDIDELDPATGAFTGALREIHGSAAGGADPADRSLSINFTLESDRLRGVFSPGREKVIMEAETLWLTFSIGPGKWVIPIRNARLPADYRDGSIRVTLGVEYSDVHDGCDFTIRIHIHLKD